MNDLLVAMLGSIFLLAVLAPLAHRLVPSRAGLLLAIVPAGWCLSALRDLPLEPAAAWQASWVPLLRLTPALAWDGLAALFTVLILGIGALVLVYADGYRAGEPRQARFLAYLLLFMGAMLGIVLAADLLTLFVFWELTSLASYLLIGFERERREAREAALGALLVTGIGGLALLAAALVSGQVAGTVMLADLEASRDRVIAHGAYPALLGLVLLAAFTKSAQVPFHFWLPAAMQAPTPVSSYLHSATMVKAGVYLLLRLTPTLGGTTAWMLTLTMTGGLTLLVAGWLALAARELKQALAYSTIATLGLLVLLIGAGTEPALQAALVTVAAHALYKAALFQTSGNLLHALGHGRLRTLAGLGAAMPFTAAAAAFAAVGMAGVPPMLGFIAKELTLAALPHPAVLLAVVAGSALLVAVAVTCGIRPFLGRPDPLAGDSRGHEGGVALWGPPLALGSAGLLAGVTPLLPLQPVLAAAAESLGQGPPVLSLWHGVNVALMAGGASIAAGLVLAATWPRWHARVARAAERVLGPARLWENVLRGVQAMAAATTARLQHGVLRGYVFIVLLTAVAAAVTPLLWLRDATAPRTEVPLPHELLLAAIAVGGALAATRARSRLLAIAALGAVGYSVAVLFASFGAPDLAMTQFAVETLTVILLLLVLRRLPRLVSGTQPAERAANLALAAGAGTLMTVLVLSCLAADWGAPVSGYHLAHSLPDARGRNVVNVILVDFRALDTLGEITVLATAALGVWALVRLRSAREDTSWIR
jgi:multicomponent Na+:H+ antiporter subunit A